MTTRGDNDNLLEHVYGDKNSAYISTSKDNKVVLNYFGAESKYIYVIRLDYLGVNKDVNAILGFESRKGNSYAKK